MASLNEALETIKWLSLFGEGGGTNALERAALLRRPSGAIIVSQGDLDDRLFIVIEGRVSVIKTLADSEDRFVREYGVGDYFGELSAFDPAPRSATVRALEDSAFLVIARDALIRCVERDGRLAMKFIVDLVRRARIDDQWLDTRRPVSERLQEVLVALGEAQNHTPAPREVLLSVSRSDLAERCYADVKTISRQLTKLVAAGAIRREGRLIRVNLQRLRGKRPKSAN